MGSLPSRIKRDVKQNRGTFLLVSREVRQNRRADPLVSSGVVAKKRGALVPKDGCSEIDMHPMRSQLLG